MKSIKLIVICIILIIGIGVEGVLSLRASLKKSGEENSFTLGSKIEKVLTNSDKNMTEVFATLFTDPTRKNVECPCEKGDKEEDEQEEGEGEIGPDGVLVVIPRKKPNKYEKKRIGFEASAFFFDYLDSVFQKEIVSEFDRIYKEAVKMTVSKDYVDPYALSSILNQPPETPIAELLKKMVSLVPTFSPQIWQLSISAGQINTIITDWGWNYDPTKPDPAKYIVDKFDFDGDGRLNMREFIIAMIRYNKKLIGTGQSCKNCLEKIAETKIEPIFMYLDCAGRNMINSEQIWNALGKLKRGTVIGYDFYKCTLENGKYRTACVNDFVLKAHKTVEGRLDKEEFRLGIFQGYWDRHVDAGKIHLDDEKNTKKFRWASDGAVDVMCEKIKQHIAKNKK